MADPWHLSSYGYSNRIYCQDKEQIPIDMGGLRLYHIRHYRAHTGGNRCFLSLCLMRDLCPPWHNKEEMFIPWIFFSVAKFFHSGKDLPVSYLSFASAFPASGGFNIDGLKYVRKAVFFEQPKSYYYCSSLWGHSTPGPLV